MSDATQSVEIERIFDAPIELIWSMWAEAEHFANWYGPTGATIPTAEMDVTVGGARRICMEMQTPDGPMQMWLVGEYLEIEPPTRLVYTESMEGSEGGDTRVIVELESVGDKTRMVMTHEGVPADSPGAMGWNMAIDKLTAYVADRT